jgi:hypothetical protein
MTDARERCPACKGGGVAVSHAEGLGTGFAVCPACYGTGRVLSPAQRAYHRLEAAAPEWAEAIWEAWELDCEDGALTVEAAFPNLDARLAYDRPKCAKWYPNSSRLVWDIDVLRGRHGEVTASSLAEAVCKALGLEEETNG